MWNKWTNHRKSYLSTPAFPVRNKLVSISAVCYIITLDPLGGLLPSLSRNTTNFGKRAKINLKPLTSVSPLCAPGSSLPAVPSPVKPGVEWSTVVVVERRCAHERIRYSAVFHTEGHITTIYNVSDKRFVNHLVKISMSKPVSICTVRSISPRWYASGTDELLLSRALDVVYTS